LDVAREPNFRRGLPYCWGHAEHELSRAARCKELSVAAATPVAAPARRASIRVSSGEGFRMRKRVWAAGRDGGRWPITVFFPQPE